MICKEHGDAHRFVKTDGLLVVFAECECGEQYQIEKRQPNWLIKLLNDAGAGVYAK